MSNSLVRAAKKAEREEREKSNRGEPNKHSLAMANLCEAQRQECANRDRK